MPTRILFITTILTTVFSLSTWAGSGWTEAGHLHSLTATSQSRIVIHTNIPESSSNCRDKERYYLDYGRAGTRFIYELLLISLETGRPVQLYVTGLCELKGKSEISKARILAN